MSDLAIGFRYNTPFSRETATKWLLLILVAIMNWLWMSYAGFRIGPAYLQTVGAIVLLAFVAVVYSYAGRDERISEFAQFGAQILALYAMLMMASYLAVSTNAPVFDRTFDSADKLLGFDWVGWTEWVKVHPHVRWLLSAAYDSLPVQALVCYVYNIHNRAFSRNSEIWWITLISGFITIVGSAAFPANNPYVFYGLESADHFTHMKHFFGLRDGTMQVLPFTDAEGLIQLPSFHTVLAITMTYNLRHNRWLFASAFVLNALLVLSCPTEGSHYFVDLFAGAVVAASAIWIVRRLRSAVFES
jgi:hypothetical protein